MRGTAVEAVDAPEKLCLRGGFTYATHNRMHARADSITAFQSLEPWALQSS